MTCVLARREDTQKGSPSTTAAGPYPAGAQLQAQDLGGPPGAGRGRKGSALGPWREHGPACMLILDFRSLELGKNTVLLF